MIADDLRRQADEFIDLAHLLTRIGRDPGERASRTHETRGPDIRGSGDMPTRSRGEPPERSARPSAALESRYGIRQDEEVPGN